MYFGLHKDFSDKSVFRDIIAGFITLVPVLYAQLFGPAAAKAPFTLVAGPSLAAIVNIVVVLCNRNCADSDEQETDYAAQLASRLGSKLTGDGINEIMIGTVEPNKHSHSYVSSNIAGFVELLEVRREAEPKPRIVYASSSSAHGFNAKVPFAETDRVDNPASLYAANKKALAKGSEQEFLSIYESLTGTVVPKSAKCFTSCNDKDGKSVWRVVLCTACTQTDAKAADPVDNFKRACRERRFAARDFVYSAEGYTKLIQTRQRLEQEVQSQTAVITGIYRDAWSDVMHGLVHVKAMRIFVESVLRYGMPAKFASFIITPPANKIPAARKALAIVLGSKSQMAGHSDDKEEKDDDEEFFPYVSLSFTPFTAPKA